MRRKQFPRLPARRYLKPTRQLALGLERLEDRAQPASLSLSLADLNLAEDGPATTATITRTGDLSQALSVAIANSDSTQVSIPGSVTIAAEQASATFAVVPVDDSVFDGDQSVTLTATATTGPLSVGPDPTFGTNGLADTPLTGASSIMPGDVLVLPDGKIVAAAATDAANSGLSNAWAVTWLNPDGTTAATAFTAFSGTTGPAVAYALARQADGKILVGGSADTDSIHDWALARYNADGTLDTSFGSLGRVVRDFNNYAAVYALQVEPDGNFLAAGVGPGGGFYIARYNTSGGLLAEQNLPVSTNSFVFPAAYDMAIGPDGKIILVGRVPNEGVSAVARLNPDLSPDTTFGPGGYRTLTAADFGGTELDLYGVEVLADGKIVVGGTAWMGDNQTNGRFATARLNPGGTYDATFAGDGTATLSLSDGVLDNAEALALAIQPDGKIVLGGYAWRSQNGRNQALARFNTDGTPDSSFTATGWYVAADRAGTTFEKIHAIALQPDGRLVAEAGYGTDHWVARFDMATGEVLNASANLTVADDELPPPTLTLSVSPATFGEDAGAAAATATITRSNMPVDADLVVTLASSDTSEATVPASVTIPAGQASATFPVAAVDDTLGDGSQTVQLTASATGLTANAGVTVTDNDPTGPALEVRVNVTGVLEQTGIAAATGTVTRYNFPLEQALVVSLTSSDTTEATVPATVTIPAGQASATFPIATVDDSFVDGTRPVTITASAPGTALTGPITYDTTWGPNSGWQNGFVNGRVAVQPDGKLVVAGTSGAVGSNADFGIYRYNANGTVDTTFGTNGRVILNLIGPSDQPDSLLIQPDGKIIVVGFGATSVISAGEIILVRLNPDGTLDGTGFGTGGIVRFSNFGGVGGALTVGALQTDGKILLAGSMGSQFAVARLNSNGSIDTTFNGVGWATTDLSSATGNRAYAIAAAPDGKIIAAGVTGQGSAATARVAVVRYNADGTPDTSFGPGGVRETDIGGTTFTDNGTDVVVQPDGKVVAAATLRSASTGSNDFAAIRYNADGTLDTGFGAGGIVTEAAASAYGGTTRLILQPDGRIVVAGTAGTYQAGTIRGRFVRLSPAGVLENRSDSAWSYSTTQSVAQDTSGNIYLAYNYGSSGTSGYVDRYRTVGGMVSGQGGLNVLDNEPFAAVNDNYSATEETVLTIGAAAGVRGNDTVTAPIDVRAELVAGPAHGTLTFNADGSFSYTPAANFFGVDAFTYRLRDGVAVTNTATVSINVADVNDAPVAVNDSYSTPEDTPLSVSVVAGQTSLSMVSDAGDWIGQGRTYNLSPATGNFSISGSATYLTVNYQNPTNGSDYWSLTFRSPFDNTPLTAGTYLNAERAAFRTPGHPGMDITGQHRGSNTLTGQFTVLQIQTNASGQVTRFAADFEQHSEGGTPALRGSLRFNYAAGAGPGVLANDSDPDSDPLQATLVSGPIHGQVSLNSDGTFTYTPAANYSGPDSFTYKANDGTVDSNVATVSLNVTAVNDFPIGVNDSATTAEDTAVTIDAVANDTDTENDPLFPVLMSPPQNGTAVVQSGRIVYTPNANFFGTDSFTYKPSDRAGAATGSLATVTVTVTPTPDGPLAFRDNFSTNQDVTLMVAAPGVLSNDFDPDGDPLTARIVSGPSSGTLTLNADGSFIYVPNPGFWGTDGFVYVAADGTGRESAAPVDLFVLQTNDPPVAVADTATTDEDKLIGIDVLANDSDPNGDSMTALVLQQPTSGTAQYSPNDGKIYYTPRANFAGSDAFTYRVYDGRLYSEPVIVTVTVNPVNDAPTANTNSYVAQEDSVLSIAAPGVLDNDFDLEQEPLTAILVSGPANGTLTLNPDGSFTYTPRANFSGPDPFSYRASDGQAQSQEAVVDLLVVASNDPPVGVDDALAVTEDTPRTILFSELLANDSDPDGDTLRILDFSLPLHGTLERAVSFNGLIYRPAPNYSGPDTFTYFPHDGTIRGNVTTVNIMVAAVNDAPTGIADSLNTAEDSILPIPASNLLDNDTDREGDAMSIGSVTQPANGTLTPATNFLGYIYRPNANFNGTDTFTYRPSDGQALGAPVTVTVTVTPVNDAPVAQPDSYTVAGGGILNVPAASGVLANDSDADGDSITVLTASLPANGTLVVQTDGSFSYTARAGYSGTDSFTYRVTDGQAQSAATTVAITVLASNSAPVGSTDFLNATEDTSLMILTSTLVANDTDPDGDVLTIGEFVQPAHGTLIRSVSFDGLLYQPEPNFFGVDIFTYRPMDSQGAQGGHVIVSIAVAAVNDPPTLAAIGDLSIPEDAGTQTANLSGITAGPGEVENLTVTATSDNLALIPNPTVAYTNLDSTGILSFAPVANASGTAVITVTVSDEAGTAVRQFTVTVTPVNDPPTTTGLPAASLLEDGPANISLTGGFADIEDGAAGLTYAVVGSTNPGLFSTVSISGGSLQLTPAANASGSAILTIQAADSGGVSVQTALAVTVAPVNDAPSFTPGANQTVTAGTGPRSVVGWATNLSPGPAGEASQGLSFEVTTSNPGLFVVLPAIDPATGTLTFIPEASAAGTATVTAVLRDTGGTANGGVDSFTRTFTITVTPNGLPTTRGVRMIGGELVITGTDAADVISVSRRGRGVRVNATLGGASFNGSFNGVVRVRVDAKGGDDTIDFSNSLPVPTWTDAGAGNDSVAGSDEVDEIYLGIGDDTATGGAGNDFIAGGTGKDLIDGGSEDDAIYGGDGDDFVIGGPGVDGLFGLSGNDLLVGASATVRNTNDSLRQILTDWDPSRPGVYDELRARILIADDATGDRLRGDAGTDWFLALLPPDTIDDREGGEQLN